MQLYTQSRITFSLASLLIQLRCTKEPQRQNDISATLQVVSGAHDKYDDYVICSNISNTHKLWSIAYAHTAHARQEVMECW